MVAFPTILVTGFEPFGDIEVNPTERLVRELHQNLDPDISGCIDTMVLPVTSEASTLVIEQIEQRVKEGKGYDVILHLGLHVKINDFALERVGINIDDYRIPDNRGDKITDKPIDPHGENAHFVSLPVRRIEDALIGKGIPCHVSYSAGTYLCNHLLYTTLNHIHQNELSMKAGFIHLPPYEMMDHETMMNGLVTIIEALMRSS